MQGRECVVLERLFRREGGQWPRREVLLPAAVAMVTAFVVVGPVFGPGVALAYDLAWSPDPRFTPFALGTATPAPRAVPSDVVAIVLGHVLGAGLAQALVLWGILVLAGVGCARLAALLAPDVTLVGRGVAAVVAVWNPFVLERLVIGHWTVLLGYAALPYLLVSCVRVRRGSTPAWSPAVGLAACGIGGANSLVICCLAVFVVLAVPGPRWRALAFAGAATLGVSFVWALPALLARVASAPAGVEAFAAKPDTPLGVLGSLVSGGGFWNTATHPSVRSIPVLALLTLLLTILSVAAAWRAARRQGVLAAALPGLVGLLTVWLSAVDPWGVWSTIVLHVPGGGVLRDSQKVLAPWVAFAAAGSGLLVRDLAKLRAAGPALAVLAAALPVMLLPSLAWGVGGRVTAVEVPADMRSVAAQLSDAEPGTVGLLPWSQYRRYTWNGDRVSLTLIPRMVDQRVIFDDSLPLASGRVAGEDLASQRVGQRIERGVPPVEALAQEGVRWVVVEKQTGLPPDATTDLPPGARVVRDGAHATLIELPDTVSGSGPDSPSLLWLGWSVTSLTWAWAAACLGRHSLRRRSNWLVGSAS